jgi:cytochrome c oxidase cbb3-type subunit 3
MPAFGRDQILKRDDLESVVNYVRSLTAGAGQPAADKSGAGKAVFTANCAACHGDDAKGKHEVGAPDLTDAASIYGKDADALYDSVWGGRQGHMPSWEGRLSPLERKILALYVLDLRSARP